MKKEIVPEMRELLIAAGFNDSDNDHDEAMVKTMQVKNMPYVNEHMVDDDFLFSDAIGTILVSRDEVTLMIPDINYVEGPYSIASGEGINILNDGLEGRRPGELLSERQSGELQSSVHNPFDSQKRKPSV